MRVRNYERLARVTRRLHQAWMVIMGFAALGYFSNSTVWISMAVLMTTLLAQVILGECPLTKLEKIFLIKAGSQNQYQGGFIQDVAEKRFGITVSPRTIAALLVTLLVTNGIIWFFVI